MLNDMPAGPTASPRTTVRDLAATRRTLKRGRKAGRPVLDWPGRRTARESVEGRLVTVEGSSESGVLILGDNESALSALLSGGAGPHISGNIKLAYLDPPYNTGNRFGHYDDALQTADWLDDLRARLITIRELLHRDGSVWLHLDDSEQHHGRCLMDEVFGAEAFVATIIWQRRTSRDNRTAFSVSHDYLHVYAPSGQKAWKRVRNGFANQGAFINPDGDPRGPWRSVPLSAQAGHGTASQFYTITTPAGTEVDPPPGRCWTYTASRFQQLVAAGRVYWPKNGTGRPRIKRYPDEVLDLAPSTVWLADDVGDTAVAKKEIIRAVGGTTPFDTPKPESLMERILHIATDPGDIVLDPYLGSGTTAVVASRMERRWVGIEAQEGTVRNIAIPRIRGASTSEEAAFTLMRADGGREQSLRDPA